jgi:hypothetical protein
VRCVESEYGIDGEQWIKNRFGACNIKGYIISSGDDVANQSFEAKYIKD